MSDVVGSLEEAIDTFNSRNKEYGNAYKNHGNIIKALFPNGVVMQSASDFNKMSLIFAITGKLARIANNFEKGHSDSALDMISFSAMLKEIIDEDS